LLACRIRLGIEEKKSGGNEERRGGGGIAAGSVAVEDDLVGVDCADAVRVRVRVRLCAAGDCVVVVVVTLTGTIIEEREAKDNEFEIHRGEHWRGESQPYKNEDKLCAWCSADIVIIIR